MYNPEMFNTDSAKVPSAPSWLQQPQSTLRQPTEGFPSGPVIMQGGAPQIGSQPAPQAPQTPKDMMIDPFAGPQRVGTSKDFPNFEDDYERPAIFKTVPQREMQTMVMEMNHSLTVEDDSHDLIFKGLPD